MPLTTMELPTAESVYENAAEDAIEHLVAKRMHGNILTGCGSTISQINKRIVRILVERKLRLDGLIFAFQDEWGRLCTKPLERGDPRLFRTVSLEIFQPLIELGFNFAKQTIWADDIYPEGTVFQPGDEMPKWEDTIRAMGGLDVLILVPGSRLHVMFAESDFATEDHWLEKQAYLSSIPVYSRQRNLDYPGIGNDLERVPMYAPTLAPGSLLRLINPDGRAIFALRGEYNRQNVVDMFASAVGPHRPATVHRILAMQGYDVRFYYDADAGALCHE